MVVILAHAMIPQRLTAARNQRYHAECSVRMGLRRDQMVAILVRATVPRLLHHQHRHQQFYQAFPVIPAVCVPCAPCTVNSDFKKDPTDVIFASATMHHKTVVFVQCAENIVKMVFAQGQMVVKFAHVHRLLLFSHIH